MAYPSRHLVWSLLKLQVSFSSLLKGVVLVARDLRQWGTCWLVNISLRLDPFCTYLFTLGAYFPRPK